MSSARKHLKTLLYVCGIPALAWLIFALALHHQRTDWMSAVRQDFPRASGPELQARSLDATCAVTKYQNLPGGICSGRDRMIRLRNFAIATLGAGLLMLAIVFAAGRLCRHNRARLLQVFQPGVVMVTVTAALMALADAFLVIAALTFGIGEFTRRVPAGLGLMTAAGAAIALYRIGRLLLTFSRETPLEVTGQMLSPERAPELWSFVSSTAEQIGTEPPQNIIAGIDPEFFVTEGAVSVAGQRLQGRTLYFSLPSCHLLSEAEFRGILGHEFAHFRGEDTEFSRRFYPCVRNCHDALNAVSSAAVTAGGGGWALLPAMWLLSFYLDRFSEVEAEISRSREFAADAAGAEITSARDFAIALIKVSSHDTAWEQTWKQLLDGPARREHGAQLPSRIFQETVRRRSKDGYRHAELARLEKEGQASGTDSHPPLSERLKALGQRLDELSAMADEFRPEHPAALVIPGADEMEWELFPDFAPASEQNQATYGYRQAGFAAMEYYGGFLNRSYLVFVSPEGLYGIQFMGLLASTKEINYFKPALELLDDAFFRPGTAEFEKQRKQSRANFFIGANQVSKVTFDSSRKWGMGKIPHAGKLRILLTDGKRREFVLLGDAYGDGIQRQILEMSRAG